MTTMLVKVPAKEKTLFMAILKKFHFESRVLSKEDKENLLLSKMMDESEKEGGEVSEVEIIKTLKRNGAKI